ncbi:hypothetical protein IWQ60_001597 [Tieghemiomyces parasiticus]|uniref:Uncharacterized protein n=1 Tax=Tieghemiomyces parasiticus TaxID=78921 RepID=A0A9W8E2E7_9FUNG|nr:hypothetical protein IWQ60_001597 [Tieghemiomyces parasiticus]
MDLSHVTSDNAELHHLTGQGEIVFQYDSAVYEGTVQHVKPFLGLVCIEVKDADGETGVYDYSFNDIQVLRFTSSAPPGSPHCVNIVPSGNALQILDTHST